jgi:hypothetical protein
MDTEDLKAWGVHTRQPVLRTCIATHRVSNVKSTMTGRIHPVTTFRITIVLAGLTNFLGDAA